MSPDNEKIQIVDLVGAPFSIDNKQGFSCWGLCQEVYKRLCCSLPTVEEITCPTQCKDFCNSVQMICERISKPIPWCLVMFWKTPGFASHIGVVLEDSHRFIHSREDLGVVIERLDNFYWMKHTEGFYEFSIAEN